MVAGLLLNLFLSAIEIEMMMMMMMSVPCFLLSSSTFADERTILRYLQDRNISQKNMGTIVNTHIQTP
jgi:hypothetical protein